MGSVDVVRYVERKGGQAFDDGVDTAVEALVGARRFAFVLAGVVGIRNEAQTRYYSLKDPQVRAIIHALCEICDHS